jgi:putative heme-binding domain-containing protein
MRIAGGGHLFLAIAIMLLSGRWAAGAEAPTSRVAWTTGRVTGSPEAPPPFRLERVFTKLKFTEPLDMDFGPGGRVYVAEKAGKIFSFPNRGDVERADLLIDLRQIVTDWKKLTGCRGFDAVYGFAFHPKFEQNHFLYVCYALDFPQRRQEPVGSRVSRFVVLTNGDDPPRVDPASEKIVIEWQAGGHNGGCVKFGPDGLLYISTGDQANPVPPDVYKTGQDISDLRASVLRIDVDHADGGGDRPYSIPRENPFVNTPGARPEVWCYGLRNPWRMSFDRAAGRLWVADVGWELWESVICAKAGGNYGWAIVEGPNPVHPDWPRGPTPISPPLLALSHAESASITGGFVYRGRRHPALAGNYIFGDWETRRLWAAKLIGEDKLEPHRTIARTDARIVAFGEDAQGELYVVDHEGGGLYSIADNPAAEQPSAFPRTLKQTGIFEDVESQKPAAGVVAFTVKAPQWMDSATAQRWVAVPGDAKIDWRTDDVYQRLQRSFPKDSVLVRTFSLEMTADNPGSNRKIETQLLHFDGKEWHAYGYRWRDDQTDADLVEENGAEQRLVIADTSMPGGKRQQTWRFASRAQCMTCHTSWSAYTLAYTEEQLDTADQLKALRAVGLLPAPYKQTSKNTPETPRPIKLANPYNESASLEDRARSYLHVNCAVCHREGGGGSAMIDVRREKTLAQTRALKQPAMLGGFGIEDARIIAPGDPGRSVLLYRLAKSGIGHMPKIGAHRVDDRAVALIGQWIAQMDGGNKEATDVAMDDLPRSTRSALTMAYRVAAGQMPEAQRADAVRRGIASPIPDIRELFEHFAGIEPADRPRLGPTFDRAKLLAMPGDPAHGREIFEKVAQCATCHLAGEVKGRPFGPDLTHIATKYDRAQLLESIVEPSKAIAEGFAGYNVTTIDGDVVSGFLIARNDAEVIIKDATLQQVHVPAGKVTQVTPMAVSIMPQGLLDNLEPQQAADLLEWLAAQK